MKVLFPAIIVLTLWLTACRKLPTVTFYRTPASGSPAPSEPVHAPAEAKPEATASTPPAIHHDAQVVVLGYQRFADNVRHPDTEITPAEFQAQMQALKDQGITVISLADFLAWRNGEKSIPARSALITIDDGYNSACTVAWPILKKLGYPFTVFIYTDYVRGGPRAGGGSLTWQQLAEMRDAGVAIESETVSHADLRGTKKHLADASYEEWLWNELHGSRELLENHLGIQVKALALPYGLGNEHIREVAAKAGYELIFTVNGRAISFDTPKDALGRYMIQANQPKVFATATAIEGGRSAGSATSTFDVKELHPLPAENAEISDPKPIIQLNLSRLVPIDPASVSVRLSGVGIVPAKFDPRTDTVTYQPRDLNPNNYTVIVTAKSQGKRIECRWNFTVEPRRDPAHAAHKTGPSN